MKPPEHRVAGPEDLAAGGGRRGSSVQIRTAASAVAVGPGVRQTMPIRMRLQNSYLHAGARAFTTSALPFQPISTRVVRRERPRDGAGLLSGQRGRRPGSGRLRRSLGPRSVGSARPARRKRRADERVHGVEARPIATSFSRAASVERAPGERRGPREGCGRVVRCRHGRGVLPRSSRPSGSPTRQSSRRTPSGTSTTPTLRPIVTTTSALLRISVLTGRLNASEVSIAELVDDRLDGGIDHTAACGAGRVHRHRPVREQRRRAQPRSVLDRRR